MIRSEPFEVMINFKLTQNTHFYRMAENVPQISESLLAEIHAWCDDKLQYYLSKRTKEERKADDERTEAWKNSEEVKQGYANQMTEAFNAADGNQDGLLT